MVLCVHVYGFFFFAFLVCSAVSAVCLPLPRCVSFFFCLLHAFFDIVIFFDVFFVLLFAIVVAVHCCCCCCGGGCSIRVYCILIIRWNSGHQTGDCHSFNFGTVRLNSELFDSHSESSEQMLHHLGEFRKRLASHNQLVTRQSCDYPPLIANSMDLGNFLIFLVVRFSLSLSLSNITTMQCQATKCYCIV